MRKKSIIKIIFQNIAIFLVVVAGIENLIFPFAYRFKFIREAGFLYSHLHPEWVALHGMVATIVGFLLLLLSYKLYKRMRYAWILEIMVLCVSVTMNLVRTRGAFSPFVILEILIVIVLAASFDDFCRRSDPMTFKWALLLAFASMSLVITRATAGFLILKNHFISIADLERRILSFHTAFIFYEFRLHHADRTTICRNFHYAQLVFYHLRGFSYFKASCL